MKQDNKDSQNSLSIENHVRVELVLQQLPVVIAARVELDLNILRRVMRA